MNPMLMHPQSWADRRWCRKLPRKNSEVRYAERFRCFKSILGAEVGDKNDSVQLRVPLNRARQFLLVSSKPATSSGRR